MEDRMPQGDKSSYTDKQKRKAEHIEEGRHEVHVLHEAPGALARGHVGPDHDERHAHVALVQPVVVVEAQVVVQYLAVVRREEDERVVAN